MNATWLALAFALGAQAPETPPSGTEPVESAPAVSPESPPADAAPAVDQPAPEPSSQPATEPAPDPATEPASQPAAEPAAEPAPEAPTSTGTAEPPVAPAPDAPKKAKRKHARAWWSNAGIAAGLATAAVAAAVLVSGMATQGLALYFWVDQTEVNRRQAEREFATRRARWTQWTALGLMLGGAAAIYGGLVAATYAFGLGNPDPTKASDL